MNAIQVQLSAYNLFNCNELSFLSQFQQGEEDTTPMLDVPKERQLKYHAVADESATEKPLTEFTTPASFAESTTGMEVRQSEHPAVGDKSATNMPLTESTTPASSAESTTGMDVRQNPAVGENLPQTCPFKLNRPLLSVLLNLQF